MYSQITEYVAQTQKVKKSQIKSFLTDWGLLEMENLLFVGKSTILINKFLIF